MTAQLIEKEGAIGPYWVAYIGGNYMGEVYESELDYFLAECPFTVEFVS